MSTAKNPVRSVERSLEIIQVLRELDGATVTDIANHLDVTKGTAHNHLSTLLAHEVVVQREGEYHLGIRLFEIGEEIRSGKQIYHVGVPEVNKLAEETGELANILIEEHGWGTYLHRAQGDRALSLDTGVGARVHLHNTGLGKAILAHLPEEYVRDVLDRNGMPATTDKTITSRGHLFEDLAAIRERGYSLDAGERAEGIRCVAAPVITRDGEIHGAISVAGPRGRMKGERLDTKIPELVTNAADVIGINLSYA
ncbi:IclR family transcriptional regulator [Halegenticoccus tardaugens]|uniref:IclR family transcriptional regulator n=1 Tax=Halegenticoccus tardaugens TaxID=2071624 RepID=UPI00100BF9E4|nr:IclR family transcriptional regulator [Halegenticoccus tardaugens]